MLTDALLGEAELVQALGGGARLGADPDAFRSFLKRLGDVPADVARLFVSLCTDGETLARRRWDRRSRHGSSSTC